MGNSRIRKIVDLLEDKKQPFLNSLSEKIRKSIAEGKNSQQCLELVTKTSDGSINKHHFPGFSMNYADLLLAFCFKKQVNRGGIDYSVDSALTDEIVKLVIEEFTLFYKKNYAEIAEQLSQEIMSNLKVREKIFSTLLSKPSLHVKEGVKEATIEILNRALDSQGDNVKDVLSQKVAAAASTAAASPIGHAIIVKVQAYIVAHLHLIILKLLAMPAVHSMIAVVVKKIVISAIIAAFLHLLIAKTGLSVGAVVAVILVPIVAGIIVNEWFSFPSNLGNEIARDVTEELGKVFPKVNKEILESALEQMLEIIPKEVMSLLENDSEIQEGVERIMTMLNI